MSLANGREYMAIPGPSVFPDRVLRAMHRTSPNIYTGELVDITDSVRRDLCTMAGTVHDLAMYVCNGHGTWEAALTNTMSRGDKVLVLGTGHFCEGWGAMARALGIETDVISFGYAATINPTRVAEALAADTSHAYRAVLIVQVDTASSVRNDIQVVRRLLDEANHPALLMVDNMASFGVEEFYMDAWGVDVMITGCQKGLMVPPGMGFVFFSDKAAKARETANCVTPYWDWRPRVDAEFYYHNFCGTAPTHNLYGLREALDIILFEEGLEAVWHRHAVLARAVAAAFDVWGEGVRLSLNIEDPSIRSHAVTTVRMGGQDGDRLREWLEAMTGVTLGIPNGAPAEVAPEYFRIGHMGHVNAHMVLGVLGSVQAGLTALNIPHSSGGLDAATAIISAG